MNYQSISDLSIVLRKNISQLPKDIDLIVGIPRSGMLPASILALHLNIKCCDLTALLKNSEIAHGSTRKAFYPHVVRPSDAQHILIVDDSILSGNSINRAKAQVSELGLSSVVSYCAVYTTKESRNNVDFAFKTLSMPRSFEWNVMHHPRLRKYCVDIDGVLCYDPTKAQNDDGARYLDFLLHATPLVIPSYTIGHLVTNRLEKYRPQTEAWLNQHGVRYEHLHMLDLPDAVTRRRLGCHAKFKSNIYSKLAKSELFIESEPAQAEEIARLSGKDVLCFGTQKMIDPKISYPLVRNTTHSFSRKAIRKIKHLVANTS